MTISSECETPYRAVHTEGETQNRYLAAVDVVKNQHATREHIMNALLIVPLVAFCALGKTPSINYSEPVIMSLLVGMSIFLRAADVDSWLKEAGEINYLDYYKTLGASYNPQSPLNRFKGCPESPCETLLWARMVGAGSLLFILLSTMSSANKGFALISGLISILIALTEAKEINKAHETFREQLRELFAAIKYRESSSVDPCPGQVRVDDTNLTESDLPEVAVAPVALYAKR